MKTAAVKRAAAEAMIKAAKGKAPIGVALVDFREPTAAELRKGRGWESLARQCHSRNEKSPRSIVREHHFEKDLAEIIGDFEAAADFIAGAAWLLAQNPRSAFPSQKVRAFGFCRWPRSKALKWRSITRSTIPPSG